MYLEFLPFKFGLLNLRNIEKHNIKYKLADIMKTRIVKMILQITTMIGVGGGKGEGGEERNIFIYVYIITIIVVK